MKSVEDWAEIRRLHLAERMPIKVIARELAAPPAPHRGVHGGSRPSSTPSRPPSGLQVVCDNDATHRRPPSRRPASHPACTCTPRPAPAPRFGGERFAAFTETVDPRRELFLTPNAMTGGRVLAGAEVGVARIRRSCPRTTSRVVLRTT
jgi:hypothetical protein